MKKIANLTKSDVRETSLRRNLDLTKEIRDDATNDLESLTEDFKHMTLVVESVQRNYKALLAQNQQLKDTLLDLVEECYCWQGNRCERCERILKVLAGDKAEEKIDPVGEYKAILKQLRKLG